MLCFFSFAHLAQTLHTDGNARLVAGSWKKEMFYQREVIFHLSKWSLPFFVSRSDVLLWQSLPYTATVDSLSFRLTFSLTHTLPFISLLLRSFDGSVPSFPSLTLALSFPLLVSLRLHSVAKRFSLFDAFLLRTKCFSFHLFSWSQWQVFYAIFIQWMNRNNDRIASGERNNEIYYRIVVDSCSITYWKKSGNNNNENLLILSRHAWWEIFSFEVKRAKRREREK